MKGSANTRKRSGKLMTIVLTPGRAVTTCAEPHDLTPRASTCVMAHGGHSRVRKILHRQQGFHDRREGTMVETFERAAPHHQKVLPTRQPRRLQVWAEHLPP